MSWESILKAKTARRRSDKAVELVDEVMSDKEPRVIKDILEILWTKVEEKKKRERTRKGTPTGRSMIPTTRELRYYLSRGKYESAVYDTITGKITGSTSTTKPYHERKYWMK